MLTLQELKKITPIPRQGVKAPTAKRLRENDEALVEKRIGKETWIAVYRNGYALYHAEGHSTVFAVHACGDYQYAPNRAGVYLPEQFLEKEPWYVRLVLEGEDRLERNQRAKEQESTVSYNAISEEWEAMGDAEGNPLHHLVGKESREEMLQCLTERQRMAVRLCFFQQKSRKEAARELGISSAAVSATLSQAVRRMRKKYLSGNQAEKAVAAI